MKNKTQLRLLTLGAIILIFSVILVLQQQWSTIFPTRTDKPYSTLDKSTITNIGINDGTIKTDIYKKNSKFYIKKDGIEFAADQNRIDQLLSSIAAFKKADPVSTNKSKHKEFGIDKQSITIKTPSQTINLYIGNSAGVGTNYVRFDTQNEVYTASNLETALAPIDYRDLGVRPISTEKNVTAISEQYDGTNLALEKKGNDWLREGEKVKKERIDFFINDLKTLKSIDIVKPDDITLGEAELIIQIKENSKDTTLNFYKKDDSTYYLDRDKLPYLYLVAVANVQSLKKQPADFTQ